MNNYSKNPFKQSEQPFQTPKHFLVPFILLCLRDLHCHGYKILQYLAQFGFSSIDQGNLYRLLRQLEKEEMIQSEWDTSKAGPARRIYSLTKVGEEYLKTCAQTLEHYQMMLDQFFKMYSAMFSFPISSEQEEKEDCALQQQIHEKRGNES